MQVSVNNIGPDDAFQPAQPVTANFTNSPAAGEHTVTVTVANPTNLVAGKGFTLAGFTGSGNTYNNSYPTTVRRESNLVPEDRDCHFPRVYFRNRSTVTTGSPTLAVGMAFTGAGVTTGTVITGGSNPNWTVDNSQTVGSSLSPVTMTVSLASQTVSPLSATGG